MQSVPRGKICIIVKGAIKQILYQEYSICMLNNKSDNIVG